MLKLLVLISLIFVSVNSQSCSLNSTQLFQARVAAFLKFVGIANDPADYDTQKNGLAGILDDNTILTVRATGTFGGPDHYGLEGIIEYLWIVNSNKNDGFYSVTAVESPRITPIGNDTLSVNYAVRVGMVNNSANITGPFNFTVNFAPCSTYIKTGYIEWDARVSDAAITIAPPTPFDMCRRIMPYCVGQYKQFDDVTQCTTYLAHLPRESCRNAAFMGNTYACRFLHHILVKYRPDIHCAHVGRNSTPCQDSGCLEGLLNPPVTCSSTPYSITFNNYN
eukprot:NODE_4498_length_1159_cov_20.548263_g3980_i0.p1 GENE.NODE_4498_length_1159_cov_20.548263_g3980_i0~~NODE_4498_length_1159_cov_20.548263_g3980_i0.p1  ORF type:complete len:279 (-),score=11.26 NODE_4498_length_1159_cov_20.548263_g3980_i0:268-1104(-)